MSIKKKVKIHFIGIGGIGISGLARIYLEKGYKISGSDLADSETIKDLRKLGAQVKIGKHQKGNLPLNTNLVVYNLAISENNSELREAKARGIRSLTYPEALGELTKKYFTLCVSGTHGKTTTTGMISLILLKAGLDPAIIIGSKLKELNNANARLGESKYLVIEADEYKRAFLNYHPDIIVITNIEEDHLDYYKDLKDIQAAFKNFVKLLPQGGFLIAVSNIVSLFHCFIVKKGIKIIDYEKGPRKAIEHALKITGEHNVKNALAAFAVGKVLGIKEEIILKALDGYTGAWRRFEIKYDKEVTVIDDYAHHPTEIRATLRAARQKYGKRRIWCVYQPHQIQRTEKLFRGFSEAFQDADRVMITKIFGVLGRDEISKANLTVLSQKLAREISRKRPQAVYSEHFSEIIHYLLKNIRRNDVVMIMGAGDINQLTPRLITVLKNQGL
ncbi:MAG: Mur ligase family protein [Patescibacteria group bacterium]|nr:Mur ligase family protein [Patescibacteria group bacterium]